MFTINCPTRKNRTDKSDTTTFCNIVSMQRESKFFAKNGSSLGHRSLTNQAYKLLSLCQILFHREQLK